MTQHIMNSKRSSSLIHSALADDASSISRRQLHDELLERLRDCIVRRELEPGEKIPEKELCERFGVSRTPLREALKVLAYEGLVVLNHNRGSVVKPIDLEDLNHAFPIYMRLETLAGELACQRMTDSEIDEIRQLHDRMVKHYKHRDVPGHLAVNEQIHERIQLGSRNRSLVHLLRSVSTRIRRARMAVIVPQSRLQSAVAEHENIMEALAKRDPSRMSRAIHTHLDNSFRAIREALLNRDVLTMNGRGKGDIGKSEAA